MLGIQKNISVSNVLAKKFRLKDGHLVSKIPFMMNYHMTVGVKLQFNVHCIISQVWLSLEVRGGI